METNELQHIWKTLAEEKLIEKELAEENIERIISLKSSATIAKLNKKLKMDFFTNGLAAVFIASATIFVSVFNKIHQHVLPVEALLFLFLTLAFFVFKSLDFYSKLKILKISDTTITIRGALNSAKKAVEKSSKREKYLTYISFIVMVVYGNILLNAYIAFSDFYVNSLQGYVLIFSVISLITMPFIEKLIFKKRFSGIINDITNSVNELEEK